MEVVGVLGYNGEQVHFSNSHDFMFSTGHGLCVMNSESGPKDVCWLSEYGIQNWAVHCSTELLVVAPKHDVGRIKVFPSRPGSQHEYCLDNPTVGAIISFSFSADGKYLVGLSDVTDHRIILWHIPSASVLVSSKLPMKCKKISVNPLNYMSCVAFGDEGMVSCKISEVIEEFSVQFETIPMTRRSDGSESLASHSVYDVQWAPQNGLIVGTSNGCVMHVDLTSKSQRILTSVSQDEAAMPMFLLLSTKNIIAGYSNGQIHWYPYDAQSKCTNDTEELSAVQTITLKTDPDATENNNFDKNLSTMCADPNFSMIIAGTSSGHMYKFPIHVQEKVVPDDFDEDAPGENGLANQSFEQQDNNNIVTTPKYSFQPGVSLCVKSLGLPIMLKSNEVVYDDGVETVKPEKKDTEDVAHVIIAGSCSGNVAVFQIDEFDNDINISKYLAPSMEDDPFAKKQAPVVKGIANSSPKIPRLLAKFIPCPDCECPRGRAISAIEVLSVSSYGGGRMVAVGTVDGWLEIWKLEVFKYEKEYAKDFLDEMNEEENDVVNDADSPDKIYADAKLVFRRKFYDNTVSLLSCSENQPLLTVASYFDKDIYVINASPSSSFTEVKSLTLGSDKNRPVSVFWKGEVVWVGCGNGLLFTFFPEIVTQVDDGDHAKDETKSEDVPSVAKAETSAIYPKAIWESRLKSMSATVPMFGAGGGIVVVRHDAAVLTVIDELPSVADMRENGLIDHENSTGEDVPLVDLPSDMTDSTTIFDISNLCVANAGCTQLIASGASDGSIFIWRAKRGDISLINKYHIHCRPVLSLCFTEDASKVISTSADGSMFVVSVDRTINRPPHTTAQLLENDLANMVNAGSICSDSVLWKEHQMELKTAELKESNKAKSMHFQSIVDNISGRLQTLLKRNEEAGELEKMDLHEFVVDVKQQKAIEEANSKKVAKLREEYENKNARNELIAARLREACWDTMETHSVSLSTIHEEDNLKFVSSFPVEKVSPGESVEIERIKRLRSIEILTQRSSSGKDNGGKSDRTPTGNWRFSWGGNLHSSPVMISWLMNDGARWARENVVEMIQEADKAAASAAEAKDKGSDSKQDDKKKKKDGKQDSPETASTDHDEGSAGELGGDGDQDVDLKNIFNLLYAPQTVRTPVQKRSQIILLKEVLRRVKGNFNKHFQALYHEKEDVVSSITAKTTRINEIIDELELAEESSPPTPQWSNIEEPDSAVKIEDSEISSRPYESEAMREERLRLEEERRRAAASEDDDARQRALLDMMNGTLEVKRDVFAEASALHRPEWMDELDPALMTEAQKKEVEEFDAKYAALQEEKAAYRKSLELEMKRLRLEIAEAKKSFDEKVHAIDRIKIFVNREILAQELYISRLALSMVKREQSWGLLKATEREIEENRKLRTELSRKIDRVSAAVENAKNSLQAVQDEEKNMDRSFKRDLQTQSNTTFDQDTLKNFTNLFRIRTFHDDGRADDGSEVSSSVIGGRNSRGMLRRRGSLKRSYGTSTNDHSTRSKLRSSRGTSNKEGMGQLQKAANELKNPEPPKVSIVNENDPFYPLFMAREKEQRAVESHIPQMIPLNIDIDCPEGFAVDPYIWSVLQELRLARIAKEIEGKRQHTAYTELKRKLDDLAAQEDAIIAQSDALKARREDILQHLQDLSEDLDVVVTLRQGQDEVECGAVVTDYSDARLLPSSIIRKYNLRINELGKEKIGVLSKIKQFRRKMNLVDWEVKHLRLEAWHLEEYYTDSQLFRVTRDLQKVIKDGSDHDQSRARLEKIAVRKDFLKKNGDAKVEKLKKAIERLRTQMEERDYENSKFTGKIDALKSDVTVREQVVSHSKKNAEKGDRHSDRMRKVVARRKLVDTAQVQAEEIDYLKQELDKVRQKTFPSFVRATRNRLVYNPDERV